MTFVPDKPQVYIESDGYIGTKEDLEDHRRHARAAAFAAEGENVSSSGFAALVEIVAQAVGASEGDRQAAVSFTAQVADLLSTYAHGYLESRSSRITDDSRYHPNMTGPVVTRRPASMSPRDLRALGPRSGLPRQPVYDGAEGTSTPIVVTGQSAAVAAVPNVVTVVRPRVTAPVRGLYESIDPENFPTVFRGRDETSRRRNGIIKIKTHVETADGATGYLDREYDPRHKKLIMLNAFFDDTLPSKVQDGIRMTLTGTPTFTYLTIRQMKRLGIRYGELREVKMSTIQNVKAVLKLESLRRAGVPVDEAVLQTHSVEYASTALTQSGSKVVSAHVEGGRRTPIKEMLEWYERGSKSTGPRDPAIIARHDKLLAEYGLKRDDKMLWDYDIFLKLVPIDGAK